MMNPFSAEHRRLTWSTGVSFAIPIAADLLGGGGAFTVARLAAVAANVTESAAKRLPDGTWIASLHARDAQRVFRSSDLAVLIGTVLRDQLKLSARNVTDREEKARVERLATCFPDLWIGTPADAVSEREVAAWFAENKGEANRGLSQAEWQQLLRDLAKRARYRREDQDLLLQESTLAYLAGRLHETFVPNVKRALAKDAERNGPTHAGLVLLMLGEILAGTKQASETKEVDLRNAAKQAAEEVLEASAGLLTAQHDELRDWLVEQHEGFRRLVSEEASQTRTHVTDEVQGAKQEILDAIQRPTEPVAPSSKPWNVPYERNPYLAGRDALIQDVRTRLLNTGQAGLLAVSGMGGIGKTQTAVHYAIRYRDEYVAVFWVSADTPELIEAGLAACAELLDLPAAKLTQAKAVAAFRVWLQKNDNWLMVFDNADTPAHLASYAKTYQNGHVLVTSRASDLSEGGTFEDSTVDVDVLPDDVGARFLLERARGVANEEAEDHDEWNDALRLADELGGLPLALEQAGAFLAQKSGMRFDTYIEDFRKRKVLAETRPKTGSYPDTVYTTWKLNIERLADEPVALDLLNVSAHFGPEPIPFEVLERGGTHINEAIPGILSDEWKGPSTLLAPLTRFSLLAIDTGDRSYTIHRMIQEVVRDEQTPGETEQRIARAASALNAAFPYVEIESWPICRRLTPHVQQIARKAPENDKTARLLNQAGYFLEERARFSEAEPLYARALKIRERVLGSDHPSTATSLNNLAGLYRQQGKYTEAEPLYARALAIYERVLGSDHPSTATSLNNLAGLYESQGKYTEAEPLYERALAILERRLGAEHPNTRIVRQNLEYLRSQL